MLASRGARLRATSARVGRWCTAASRLAGHEPASAAELATWSGLPLRKARAGLDTLAAQVEDVVVAGRPAYQLPGKGKASVDDRTVRLVPAFDEYTLGYRGRDLALDPAHATRILAGGIVHPAVVAGAASSGPAGSGWRADG